MGYHRAGFEVTGVDIEPQRRYPFRFIQAEAIDFMRHLIESGEIKTFDAIHASPPCQDYTPMRFVTKRRYERLIDPTRELLIAAGLPYVLENVSGAPIADLPMFNAHRIILCGAMFGLKVYRHRKFESSLSLSAPPHPPHLVRCAKQGRPAKPGEFVTVTGNCSGADYARAAMGIDWMVRDELSQAIPPAYTQFIGEQLIKAI